MRLQRKPPPGNVRRVVPIKNNTRGTMTNKAGEEVQFESAQEEALYLRFLRDRTIENFRSQPERFTYTDDEGHERSYVPDAVAWRVDGTEEFHEVTISARRSEPGAIRRERGAQKICRERGSHYIVHTEESLPSGAELANLKTLYSYQGGASANDRVTEEVYMRLKPNVPVLFATLVYDIANALALAEGTVVAALCHMLWHSQIETNFHQLLFIEDMIAPKASIWLDEPKEEDHGFDQ